MAKELDEMFREWLLTDGIAEMGSKDPAKLLQILVWDWVRPDIERRKAAGEISAEWELTAAQVVIDLSKAEDRVRLNEEILDPVSFPADIAHITMTQDKGEWVISICLDYNSEKIEAHIKRATEFFEAAKFSFDKENLHACVDNLFSCTELLSKAYLFTLPDRSVDGIKSHGAANSKFAAVANKKYVDLRKRLTKLRNGARYADDKLNSTKAEIVTLVERSNEMLEAVREAAKRD